ncbi:MAG: thiolase family protein [Planctomycetota bacterium]|jgi:acetyl-CoA acetyltransferase family protein
MGEAFIVEAKRTPVGKRDGWLRDTRADDLLAHALHAVLDASGAPAERVEDVVAGCVTQTGEQGVNITRNAVLAAGLPLRIPGTSVNRLCGSGLQAVNFAAMGVMAGQLDLAIGGGTENMSRTPMGSDVGTFSRGLTDRYELIQQGLSAELVAERWDISREALDQFAYDSHRKALHAQSEGRFDREIAPIEVKDERGKITAVVTKDEGPRAGTSLERIATLKPAFKPGGVITAASSSQISDGAAAMLIASAGAADELGLTKRARFLSMVSVGVDPTLMLSGPIPATRMALAKAGLQLSDIDLFEVNEAFASVVLAWQKELDVDPSKVNVNGGACALGHPLGCTGARLLTTLLHELERQELRYGLVTLCIGMGQGIATIIERL